MIINWFKHINIFFNDRHARGKKSDALNMAPRAAADYNFMKAFIKSESCQWLSHLDVQLKGMCLKYCFSFSICLWERNIFNPKALIVHSECEHVWAEAAGERKMVEAIRLVEICQRSTATSPIWRCRNSGWETAWKLSAWSIRCNPWGFQEKFNLVREDGHFGGNSKFLSQKTSITQRNELSNGQSSNILLSFTVKQFFKEQVWDDGRSSAGQSVRVKVLVQRCQQVQSNTGEGRDAEGGIPKLAWHAVRLSS